VTRIVLASSNPGKLSELTALLAPLRLELIRQSELGIAAPAETGTTFRENALLKARYAAQHSALAALADDSGLEVDALGGRPGVWSARYAGAGASDTANLERLLEELDATPAVKRGARYQCVIAYVRGAEDPQPLIATGTWEGRIARVPAGGGGFGYDPVFVPAGETCTAAQLAPARKNAISHRAQALHALIAGLAREGYIAGS
jgi:XTP/dITP diphosphohydrolase